MNKKKVFFCIDFEDWYHIPYLSKYNLKESKNVGFADKIDSFVDWLDTEKIKANIFVVGNLALRNKERLRRWHEKGHEIGCHSYEHASIGDMSNEEFISDTSRAKEIIEKSIGSRIFGYRAPFFSMSKEKLDLLLKMGFKYDSSLIHSNLNSYYKILDMSAFRKRESLVYENNNFFEFEIPTINNKPIAGGGFFRLYPFFVYKRFLKRFIKKENNFVFFIHPFEIAGNIRFEYTSYLNIKDRIRFNLGRKSAIKKIKKTIWFFKRNGYTFCTFSDFLNNV